MIRLNATNLERVLHPERLLTRYKLAARLHKFCSQPTRLVTQILRNLSAADLISVHKVHSFGERSAL